MKRLTLLLATISLIALSAFTIDGERKIPAVDIKNMDGETFSTKGIVNEGKPIIISFWATWCKPCIKELDNIAEVYEDWQDETGVKVVAISIDDTRATARAVSAVKAKGWEYEAYFDANQDFKRAMNVNNVPHLFIIDGAGNIVYEKNSYTEGSEDHLYELVEKLAKGEKIDH